MPKCKICKQTFTPKYSTLQKTCLKAECVNTFYQQNKPKIQKQIAKNEKKELQIKVVNYSDKLQSKVQEIARLIDKDLNCLAKNTPTKQVHGGHVFSRGGHSNFKYNLHNIHRQSAHSNHFQNDDRLMHEGIVREYGSEYLDFINSLQQTSLLKLSNIEWLSKYQIACKIANRLRKEGKNYTLHERINLRNSVNLELGIYEPIYCNFNL